MQGQYSKLEHLLKSIGNFKWEDYEFEISNLNVSGKYALAVRPEMMKISKEKVRKNAFKEIVDVTTFLGSFTRMTLKAFNNLIQVDLPIEVAKEFEKGDEVYAYFECQDALLIKND
jgi:ABC-type Fe3+/spermidine/putrescine transport system ATPase subunit